MRTPMFIALGAIVVVSACERRTATPATTADSTAVTADSVPADSATGVSSMTATKATTKAPTDSIIGRDSAFGPIGMIDSTGKVVPIRPKRP